MKKKHVEKVNVAVMGTWNWLEVAANLLQDAGLSCKTIPDFQGRIAFIKWILSGQWRQFDIIHHIRGTSWFYGAAFALIRKPVIWHWIGTDAMYFGKICQGAGGLRGWLTRIAVKKWSYAHLADSPELSAELALYGIKAEVVRLLPKIVESQIEPLPKEPCVLSYWSPASRDFHNAKIVMELAKTFSDIPFLVVGDDGDGMHAPRNVKFLGRLPDLTEVYSKISVYIRLVEHDSLSAMILETLVRGRYAIYSKEFPHTEFATDFPEAEKALRKILFLNESNNAGAEYIKRNYSLKNEVASLRKKYEKWLS